MKCYPIGAAVVLAQFAALGQANLFVNGGFESIPAHTTYNSNTAAAWFPWMTDPVSSIQVQSAGVQMGVAADYGTDSPIAANGTNFALYTSSGESLLEVYVDGLTVGQPYQVDFYWGHTYAYDAGNDELKAYWGEAPGTGGTLFYSADQNIPATSSRTWYEALDLNPEWQGGTLSEPILLKGKAYSSIDPVTVTLTASVSGMYVTFALKASGWDIAIDAVKVIRAPAPVLQVLRSGTDVAIGWPMAFSTYKLYATDRLDDGANWELVPDIPVLWNQSLWVTNAIASPSRFYRLQSP